MDLLSSILEGPPDAGYGTGLYDFGYAPTSQPPARAATTASQLESGGSGFNWGGLSNTIADITKTYMQVEAIKASRPEMPTTYRTNGDGVTYATDPAYRTLGGVGSAIGGIPTAWLLIGGLIAAAVILGKD